MNSRQFAQHVRKVADFLDAQGEVDLDNAFISEKIPSVKTRDEAKEFKTTFTFYAKEKFVAMAKLIGNATKNVGEGEFATFYLHSNKLPISLSIPRDKVCRKTVSYDCEPLFSGEELDSLGG